MEKVIGWRFFLLVSMSSLLCCCSQSPSRAFDVVAMQRSGDPVFDVRVSFAGFPEFEFGDLYPRDSERGLKVYGLFQGDWPDEIHVRWKSRIEQARFDTHTLVVPPPLDLEPGETLQLVVQFDAGAVQVHSRAYKHVDRRASYRYKSKQG
ncbi:hypothetical protein [Wenzhouxiangella marina]|uniref:hypothetical protein n=1 Tax=Wenzhouxiangella marina TaxID=1579979 RepID=UPI0012E27711|nr:hypothetical protein [Wenzhouxiangella marina]MBB6087302.1 hypothetical protein [Wenzhouxiangella marina]